MNPADPPRQTGDRRILLAIEPTGSERSALEILRCLIGDALPEMLGLIIEDNRVMAHLQSHLAREVVLSGFDRPLKRTELTRQMRAQAEVTKRRVESSSARLGMHCRLEVARGELLAELARRAADTETMILAEEIESEELRVRWRRAARDLLLAPTRTLLFARSGWATGRSVLAIIDEPGRARAVLEVSRQLAARSKSPLRILVAAATSEEREAVLHKIAELAPPSRASEIIIAEGQSAMNVVADTYLDRARLVVVPWHDGTDGNEPIAEIFTRTRGAILLVK